MSKDQKKKDNKTVYIDDGRTIVDMSAFGGSSKKPNNRGPIGSGFKDKMRTYFESVKLMLLPMLLVLGLIAIAFLILYLLLSLA